MFSVTRMTRRALLGAVAGAMLAGGIAGQAQAADPYFKGRNVKILVGYPAGGPQDLTARLFAKYLRNHLAGQPSVIVQNMPGAGSVKAQNYVYEIAKGDGETLMWVPWYPVGQILKSPGVRFDYKKYQVIGMYHIPGFFVYARNDAFPGGKANGKDIDKAKRIVFAGGSPQSGYDMHATLSFRMLGAPYTHVTGYRGSAPMRAAILKGEATFAADVGSTIPSSLDKLLFKPGVANVLYGFPMPGKNGGWVQDPTLAAYPTVIDAYKAKFGKDPSGPSWDLMSLIMRLYHLTQMVAAPPSTPKAIVDEIRAGYHATLADAAFRAEYQKRFNFAPDAASQDDIDALIGSLDKVDPKLVAALKAHITAKHSRRSGGMKKK